MLAEDLAETVIIGKSSRVEDKKFGETSRLTEPTATIEKATIMPPDENQPKADLRPATETTKSLSPLRWFVLGAIISGGVAAIILVALVATAVHTLNKHFDANRLSAVGQNEKIVA
jgi:phosphotransferase system  glucose/maltose/N-acetylglucosamine-specific IIC component